jgi:hypothetical protein
MKGAGVVNGGAFDPLTENRQAVARREARGLSLSWQKPAEAAKKVNNHALHTPAQGAGKNKHLSSRSAEVDLAALSCLIHDDEAFLLEVSQRLDSLQNFVTERTKKMGLDPASDSRSFTAEAEEALRGAFRMLDTNDSGTLSWDELENGVKEKATAEGIDMVSLSNTFSSIESKFTEEEFQEDHFVQVMREKANLKIDQFNGLLHTIYRHVQRLGLHMDLEAHAVDHPGVHKRFTKLLESQTIDASSVEDEAADSPLNGA